MLWNLEADIAGVFSLRVLASRQTESYDHGSSVSLLRMIFPEIIWISDLVEIIKVFSIFLVRRLIFFSSQRILSCIVVRVVNGSRWPQPEFIFQYAADSGQLLPDAASII